MIVFLRSEELTRFLNAAMALGILLVVTATYRRGDWIHYRITDYILALLRLTAAAFSRSVDLLKNISSTDNKGQKISTWRALSKQIMPVGRGLLIALPVMVVLAVLLSSADPIFNDRLKSFLDFLDLSRIPEYFLRLFYVIFILAYLFSGAYLHAILPVNKQTPSDQRKPWLKPFLGWTESSVVLLCVNLLFVFFVAIQFHYLFGGEANITATSYTYSEYARKGFGELVAVAIISLLLYLALNAVSRRETRFQQAGFSILAVLLTALVLVILVSGQVRAGERTVDMSRVKRRSQGAKGTQPYGAERSTPSAALLVAHNPRDALLLLLRI